MTMTNVMIINGYKAIIQYDPDIDLFRGEFIGLNGGADFYAATVQDLHEEGRQSLKVFLDMCKEDGVNPRKRFTGRFNLRLQQDLYEKAATHAKASGKSINAWIADVIRDTDSPAHR